MTVPRESPAQASRPGCRDTPADGGLACDLAGAVLVTLFVYLLGRPLFGIP